MVCGRCLWPVQFVADMDVKLSTMMTECALFCLDARGPDGLQGATLSVLLMVAWTTVIKGYANIYVV